MGLSCCLKIVKCLLLFINTLIWVLGIVVVAFAAWLLADPTIYLSVTQEETKYYAGLYVFLVVGAVFVIVAFLGCCGAMKESRCMLVTFFCIMLIGVVAQIAAAWWCATNTEHLKHQIRLAVEATVKNEYDGFNTRTKAFDAIQTDLKCCGVSGPKDWQGSLYSKNILKAQEQTKDDTLLNQGIDLFNKLTLTAGSGSLNVYVLPESCCNIGGDVCKVNTRLPVTASINPYINSSGCLDKIFDYASEHLSILIGIVLGIIVLEVLSLIFSLILCCAVDRSDRYKA